MKLKRSVITLSALIVLAILPNFTYAQNNAFSGVQNMGATLNSAGNDTNPVISPAGLSLYFSSDRPGGQGGRDIYVSQRLTLNSAWGTPQNLGAPLNSANDDNITGISLDGRTALITSDRTGAGGLGGLDLYLSTRPNANNDFGWTTPVNLGAAINSPFQDITGDFFEDPATGAVSLVFSSDRLFMDGAAYRLYQSTRNPNGTYNTPMLIEELNASGAHYATAIRRDGLEVFFTSHRAGALNPFLADIWRSTRASTSAPWNPPVLAAVINSLDEDRQPKLSPDGSVLFFHSDRVGGFGGYDLYSATRCSLYASNLPCNVNRTVGDFDGDGHTDLSVFRPSDGTWYLMQSGTNTFRAQPFGANGDKIVPGDYDGDGRTDYAVFRQAASAGVW
ncbi:MAG: FG-GAP-like repeat-containing protein, partial [Pyrinomonadaceae bacterium]